jgi:beta-1,4-mannosyl-glycoprotein beta-1,4-N-acetylglucosaminyltransferase|tara:strand:- start:287 stop:1144 length:858 start_codon:yes stop_codon:yes gene_type:complete
MEKIINMNQEELTKLSQIQPSKVIDCFIFNSELDMLEFRLMELDDVVDIFILVESTRTFSGLPKDLHFHLNKKRFSKWLHKIHYHVVDDMPTGSSITHTWFRENHQRNSIKIPLSQLSPKPKDIILLNDLDEIPDVKVIQHFKDNSIPMNAVSLLQDWYYYNLTTRMDVPPNDKAKCFYYKVFINSKLTMHAIRNQDWLKIPNTGWHFSYFMSVDKVIEKIREAAHQEYNTPEIVNPERLRKLIKEGKDILPGRIENNLFFQLPIKHNNFLPKNYKFWLENNRTL